MIYPFYAHDLPTRFSEEPDLVYVDVWERHVTAIEDPEILEPALGGADTSTRVRTVAQVKIERGESDVSAVAERAERTCRMSSGGDYYGLENRLYRVEIHEASPAGMTFKWSRDNGTTVFAIEAFPASPRPGEGSRSAAVPCR